mmetsp:Transcript_23777/g.45213  ORF Transcript_23777/g.45213 Transcript_23777/m.45213 type:complete len:1077 (-) Transcript_23777:248-3478(-)
MARTVLKRSVGDSKAVQESASKRARIDERQIPSTSQSSNSNKKGSVLRVHLRNFMTYGDVQFEPGKRLNVVVGPNGTGKSSFVCALCMGLAGRPSLLGRGDRVTEFIKRGEEFAELEVVLCTGVDSKPLTIYRKIKKDNSSEWRINGSAALLRDVELAIAHLNVQLDNLCQFLPQDRVVAFAQLSPKDLLLETEKAVGDAQLFSLHSQLIESRNAIKGLATRVAGHEAQLARLKEQNQALERDVGRASERKRLQQEIEDHKKKLLWLKFDEVNEQLKKTREDLKAVMNQMRAKEADLQAAEAPHKERLALRQSAEEERRRVKLRLVDLDKQKTTLDDQLLQLAADYDQTRRELQSLQDMAAERKRQIESLTGDVAALERSKCDLGDPPDDAQEMEAIKLEVRELSISVKSAQSRRREHEGAKAASLRKLEELQNKMRRLDDVRNQRLRALSQQNTGVLSAYEWVQANRRRFQDQVYGPILAEVHVAEKQHAKYLEMHCPNFLWSSFVTVCDADRRLLEAEVGKRFQVNIVNYTGDVSASVAAPAVLHSLGRFDVHRTLAMCLDAPPVVQLILNDHAGTSRAFVGTMNTEAQMNKVVEEPGVSCVWTPKSQYTIITSKYSDSKSSRVVQVREPRLFTSSASQQEKDQLAARCRECKNEIASLDELIKKCDSDIKKLDAELSEKKRRQELLLRARSDFENKVNALTHQIMQKTMTIQSLQAHSQQQDEQRVNEQAADIRQSLLVKVAAFLGVLTEMGSLQLQLDPATLAVAELEEQAKFLKKQLEEFEAEGGHLMARKQELTKQERRLHAKAEAAMGEAKKVVGIPDDSLQEKFDNMPDSVEELRQYISDRQLEMDTIVVRDPNALAVYQERAERIQELEATLNQDRATLEGDESQIRRMRDEWFPKLREMVHRMNAAFAQSFREIGCVGELTLQEHEDFDKFEMCVWVKFREEEPLQLLSSHRQSGGERSVSTMLYLIALQEFTKCPFRVVDEINQGMDAVNERKVFTKMVEAACRPDTPQCFLLTPKLLPQLEYSPEMTILCIMNGPRIDNIARTWRTNSEYKFFKPANATAPGRL